MYITIHPSFRGNHKSVPSLVCTDNYVPQLGRDPEESPLSLVYNYKYTAALEGSTREPSVPSVYNYIPLLWREPQESLSLVFGFYVALRPRRRDDLIRDGDRVGRGQGDWLDRGNRPKKTGETVDRRQNNGSVKAVSPRHCPATCAPCNCSFNCCAGQSH